MNLLKLIILFVIFSNFANSNAQELDRTSYTPSQLNLANKNILYNMVTALKQNGELIHGFLIGLKSDTLVISKNKKNIHLPIKDLLNVTIKVDHHNFKPIIIGSIVGLYVGNLMVFSAENQPIAYWNNDSPVAKALVGTLFLFVGGGIGYIVESLNRKDEAIFDFSGNQENIEKEIKELSNFLKDETIQGKFHLNCYLSHVYTRTTNPDMGYRYHDVTSFNLLRKIQIAYSWNSNINFGISICWFGEPSNYYHNSHHGSLVFGDQTYRGIGYYATVDYKLLSNILGHTLRWSIGIGFGFGDVDYSWSPNKDTGFPNYISQDQEMKFNGTYFSTIANTQFEVLLFEEMSLGLFADYIYLPEEIPAYPAMNTDSRNLGNFSIGLTFGFHF